MNENMGLESKGKKEKKKEKERERNDECDAIERARPGSIGRIGYQNSCM